MYRYYQPTMIHFGEDSLNQLGRIGAGYGTSCMLVTTADVPPMKELFNRVKNILEDNSIEVIHFSKVEPNPTTELLEEGFELIKDKNVDFILAVGGGSSIDSAKILALTYGLDQIDWKYLFDNFTSPFEMYPSISRKHLPVVAVSTTSGTGSQLTQAAVVSAGEEKLTVFHPDNFPRECIVDPRLMLTLPPKLTAATGFDAFSHAFESYINPRASLFGEIQSRKAMELVIHNLPKAVAEGNNIELRTNLAYADTLAGAALTNGGADLPHPLSEIIGGLTHISHGEALAVVFPAYCEQFYRKNVKKFADTARLFDPVLKESSDEVAAKQLSILLAEFLNDIGLRKGLKDFDVKEEDITAIINHPVLGFLPFATKEESQNVLKRSL